MVCALASVLVAGTDGAGSIGLVALAGGAVLGGSDGADILGSGDARGAGADGGVAMSSLSSLALSIRCSGSEPSATANASLAFSSSVLPV